MNEKTEQPKTDCIRTPADLANRVIMLAVKARHVALSASDDPDGYKLLVAAHDELDAAVGELEARCLSDFLEVFGRRWNASWELDPLKLAPASPMQTLHPAFKSTDGK